MLEKWAVMRRELRWAAGKRVFDARRVVERVQRAGDPSRFPLQRRRVQREALLPGRRSDPHDDRRNALAAGLFNQQVLLLLALGVRVAKPGCLQVLLDVAAEGEGEDGEDADRREALLRVLPGQGGDPCHDSFEHLRRWGTEQ